MRLLGTLGGGNRDQGRQKVGRSRSGTKYARDSRSRPNPFPTRHSADSSITTLTLGFLHLNNIVRRQIVPKGSGVRCVCSTLDTLLPSHNKFSGYIFSNISKASVFFFFCNESWCFGLNHAVCNRSTIVEAHR